MKQEMGNWFMELKSEKSTEKKTENDWEEENIDLQNQEIVS